MKKRITWIILTSVSLFTLNVTNVKAYLLWGGGVFNPLSVSVYRNSSALAYSATSYYTQWKDKCGIQFVISSSLSADILMGVSNESNGTYATTYKTGIGKFNIVYYKAFNDIDLTKQRETVVHEVGHALGLDHTQPAYESISVMRALNFNNKPYPLSDDIAGIKAIYN